MERFSQVRTALFVLLGLMVLIANGCTPLYNEVMPTVQAGPVYDQFYPCYVELYTVSQIRAKFAQHGGIPGHAIMYPREHARIVRLNTRPSRCVMQKR